MGRRKLNLAGLAPRVLAANAGSGSGAAVSITGSGGGPPPGRGALHISQWRALATLFNVHFEQAQGMCWPCFFAASCALNVIVIAVRRVPRASERDFRELGLDHTPCERARATFRAMQVKGDSLQSERQFCATLVNSS